MHYNVNVAFCYTSVLFGKGDGISKEFLSWKLEKVVKVRKS